MIKKKMSDIISDKFDIPIDGILDVPNAHFIGNKHLDIDGCMSIKKYDIDEIIIRCKNYLLKISGSELSMLEFSKGRILIKGYISQYQIEYLK
ncbi:MAG: YabP/YqfC family sporulation protein [Clostridia bacterium]|nr:YabP/YqfC family sporulation protein [Clostridia bacterium]